MLILDFILAKNEESILKVGYKNCATTLARDTQAFLYAKSSSRFIIAGVVSKIKFSFNRKSIVLPPSRNDAEFDVCKLHHRPFKYTQGSHIERQAK